MSRVSRRGLLRAGAALGVAGVAGAGAAATRADEEATGAAVVPFDGLHQSGILTPRPAHAEHVSFDVASRDRRELRDALQVLSGTAHELTAAGDALTVTLGFGASLFDGRFGLADARPAPLARMRRFPADALEDAQSDGDLLLQLCAGTPDTVLRAHRELARATRGALVPRWSVTGFTPADGRNTLGFRDGTANPRTDDSAAMRDVVWTGDEGPRWAVGGTHMALRVIRTRVERWDRMAEAEQEAAVGRTRGTDRLKADRPTDSHVDRARPAGEPARMLRRPFTYARGLDAVGELDVGLVFCAFQRDPRTGVDAALERMAGERLEAVTRTTGGGAFFLPPGARGPADWVGSGLFAAT